MRRLVLPSVAIVFLLAAGTASAWPERSSAGSTALYSMRIVYTDSVNPTSVVGTGQINDAQRLSSFVFDDPYLGHTSVLISSWPNFSVFSKNGSEWYEAFAGDTEPLVDPGLALRLDPRAGRAVGTEMIDGVRTTKVILAVRGRDVDVLAPSFMPSFFDRTGIPVTIWVDSSGAVRQLHAVVKITSGKYVMSKTVIDERLSAFGTPVQLSRPTTHNARPPRANLVESALDRALIDVTSYYYDHHYSYVGMTPRVMQDDDSMFPDVKIVRPTKTSYCIQATLNGVTAHQNGPKAPYAAGPC
ncbi:MAG: hypothetical protein QOH23_2589 [Gaiellaceae bacterium]|nr:hypothetical protein [Gaiellaceae bacterium]